MHIYNGVNLDYKYETSTALKTKTEEMLCDVVMDNYINAELYKKGDKGIQHRLKEQHLELHPELYQEKIIKELHIITTILRHNGYKWIFSFADASQIIEIPSYMCSKCCGKYEINIDNGITRWYIQERGVIKW